MDRLTYVQIDDMERKELSAIFKREVNVAFQLKHPPVDMSIENCTGGVRNAYYAMLHGRNTDVAH